MAAKKTSMGHDHAHGAEFGVRFPDEYRTFLAEIGSGGAGPMYGIFPLTRVNGAWRWDGDGADLVSSLREPFPHMSAWTRHSASVRTKRTRTPTGGSVTPGTRPFISTRIRRTEPSAICHEGCAIRDWLVVTGPERGNIWLDDRANDGGLLPHESGARRVTFGAWYLDWLATAEREVDCRKLGVGL
jgi:hypothetical protein